MGLLVLFLGFLGGRENMHIEVHIHTFFVKSFREAVVLVIVVGGVLEGFAEAGGGLVHFVLSSHELNCLGIGMVI